MTTAGIKVGDMVLVDKKGRRFHAEVTGGVGTGLFTVRPISPNITWRACTSREIIKHWRASRRGT